MLGIDCIGASTARGAIASAELFWDSRGGGEGVCCGVGAGYRVHAKATALQSRRPRA